ncbi:MAG: restriction endonuclease [Phycisphaerae bacterium]|nr:restriction endonuclease [Phycisphaerae bacterium]
MSEPRFWVVRVPKGQDWIDAAREKKMVAVGFVLDGDLSGVTDKEEMKRRYRELRPGASENKVANAVGQLFRVVHVISPGDWILTPDRSARTVLFGVAGDYFYEKDVLGPTISHGRKVKWLGEFSRDEMSQALKNSSGGATTVLLLDPHADELLKLMKQGGTGKLEPGISEPPDEPATPFLEEVRGKADELIGDMVSKIDPYDLQELVAGLLEAMGYRTRVSAPGPDHGVDVIAHPDALGFESPRIKVQIKHRQSSAGGPDVRNLVGTLNQGEKGLFVSTGGFSTEARREAEKGGRVTLVDAEELVGFLTEYYDRLDSDYKALIPLRKVWVPASE